jgi:hypothetical protein
LVVVMLAAGLGRVVVEVIGEVEVRWVGVGRVGVTGEVGEEEVGERVGEEEVVVSSTGWVLWQSMR